MMLGRIVLMAITFASLALSNIIFPFVQPACDRSLATPQYGCLRGQVCLTDNTCATYPGLQYLQPRDTSPRADGRCGTDFGGATCDPKGAYGGCCSTYGFCGTTVDHCLASNGCKSGCTGSLTSSSGVSNTATETANSEPVIGTSTSTASTAAAVGSVTTDGTCGASNGGTTCGNWPQGGCCSLYGFCGSSTAHCAAGCQSGPCEQAPAQAVPSASPAPPNSNPGSFKVVGQSGVPAMHAALLPNGNVVFLDKVEDYAQLRLSSGHYAYSAEYDVTTNTAKPLAYKSNAFCSGGAFLANGTLLNVGGNAPLTWLDPTVRDGFRGIRYLTRSASDRNFDDQSWIEPGNQLNTARWYASAQTLSDGSIFVASGSLNGLNPTVPSNNNPTYEILNQDGTSQGKSIAMPLLVKAQPYYMYPFLYLLEDGTLFAFVSKSSEIFDVTNSKTLKTFPDLPGDYRTYPNGGGSVLLPLSSASRWTGDVMVCGGGAYQDITSPTDPSCGRISPTSLNADWEMDSMPEGRGMVEGTLLPDGTVLWINGARKGAEGYNLATDPALEALIYDPRAPLGKRWTTGAQTQIPRLYHSVALLLLDGTVMVAGSNPDEIPVLTSDPQGFHTEFRVEIYTPPYLSGENASRRPTNIALALANGVVRSNSALFGIAFTAPAGAKTVSVVLYHGGFVTHAVHMGQRMLILDVAGWQARGTEQIITVTGPPNGHVAPPGPYVVYVVVDGVPGMGQFVLVG